jgi:fumarate hydratase class II
MDIKKYRIEKDSMGEVRVPSNALYGAQTQRAVENFTISSKRLPWKFLEAILLIKKAAAISNRDIGLLSNEHAEHICDAVDEILVTRPLDQFPVSVFQTGSGTSTNMNVNEVIVGVIDKKGVELSPNDHVNMG